MQVIFINVAIIISNNLSTVACINNAAANESIGIKAMLNPRLKAFLGRTFSFLKQSPVIKYPGI
jgi:hypothetical protein